MPFLKFQAQLVQNRHCIQLLRMEGGKGANGKIWRWIGGLGKINFDKKLLQ